MKSLKKVLKKVNSLKKVLNKPLRNTLLYKVKYVLLNMLDNSEMWLIKALLSSIEGGFQSKKTLHRHAGPIVVNSLF